MSSVRKPCLLAARSHPAGKRLFVLPLLVAGRGLEGETQPSQVLQTLKKAEAGRQADVPDGEAGREGKKERKTTMAVFSSNADVLRFFSPSSFSSSSSSFFALDCGRSKMAASGFLGGRWRRCNACSSK